MKKKLLLMFAIILLASFSNTANAQINAVYVGGLADDNVVDEIRASGFNTAIVFSIHIYPNGDLALNNDWIVQNRQFVFSAQASGAARLFQAPTSVTRLEFMLSAAGSGSYQHVKDFYDTNLSAFEPGGILYDNFRVLFDNIPQITAVNNDDETTYDVPSSVHFHKMFARMGKKSTIVPYRNANTYWRPLVEQVHQEYPNHFEYNYIQCYAGGGNNDPCQSQWDFGIPNVGGLWGGAGSGGEMTASQIQTTMTGWNNACGSKNAGGFVWRYGFIPGQLQSYAQAVNNAFNSGNGNSGGTNIALNKAVFADSEWSAQYPKSNINDGDTNTRWASASNGQTHWLYYDLGANYDISEVQVLFEAAYASHFELYTSTDAVNWSVFYTTTNNTALEKTVNNVNRTARYVSISTYAAPYDHVSIWEMSVFGTISGGSNIALNKTVFADSEWSAQYAKSNINDGDTNTRWASASNGQTHWLYYDLGANYDVSEVQVLFETAYASHFELYTSTDAVNWNAFYTTTNNTALEKTVNDVNRTARYVSISTYAAPYDHVSIWEMSVFGNLSNSAKNANRKQNPLPLLDKEFSLNKELKVFPNPARNNINISLKGFKKADIFIVDLLGKTVYKTTTNKADLNLSKSNTFKTGLYIIKAIDENNKQYFSKLVVE